MIIIDGRGRHSSHLSGDRHPNWKGDGVGYGALHSWIVRKLGKAVSCTNCRVLDAKKYEWANLSGQYRRDLADWVQLCCSCHKKLDYGRIPGWDRGGNPNCLVCLSSKKPPHKVGVCTTCYYREYSRRKRGYYSDRTVTH